MNTAKQLEFERTRKAIYLRLDDKEYKYISSLSKERGEKIQDLLKASFFNGENKRPIMDKESSTQVITELKRIGNNVNQIARKLNSGFRSGWSDSFETCASDIENIRELLASHVYS